MKISRKKIAFFGDSLTEGFPGTAYIELLKLRLQKHTLFNYGKGGDTVISLYERINKADLDSPFDISVLWIGVNDIFVKTSWTYPVLKKIRKQPWSKNQQEFQDYFVKLYQYILKKSDFLIALSPLFIGEDLNNLWNRQLKEIGIFINNISSSQQNMEFIDLQEVFSPHLKDIAISPHVPKSALKMLYSVFAAKSKKQLRDLSDRKGLFYTIDGVHLNSAGATIVADTLFNSLKKQL